VRITGLEHQLVGLESDKEAATAALTRASAELEAARELADVRERLDATESRLDQATARAAAACEERDELAAKAATLAGDLARKDRQLEESGALLRQVSEALALQRDTTAAAHDLAAARGVEAAKALEAARVQVAALEGQVARLTVEAAKVPAMERGQAELCAQLAAVERERRAASARARDAESQVRNYCCGCGDTDLGGRV
jgi:chromosome segregation ATPase